MKFAIYAVAFLPLAGALQADYLSHLAQGAATSAAPDGGRAFVPGGKAFFPPAPSADNAQPPPAPEQVPGNAMRVFYPDPAAEQVNPLATNKRYPNVPGSDQAPDGTKPPQVSMINKGTYERLNGVRGEGYLFPDPASVQLNPLSTNRYGNAPGSDQAPDGTKPPQISMLNKGTYERVNGPPAAGYLYPDPAVTPSNPLATGKYANAPGSDQAPDGTKPPQVSMLNKGTYERLNGPPAKGYLYPDPAVTPSNPLATGRYADAPGSDQAPDGTKPPQVSVLNKGTYERLNGYQNPVAVNTENPFSRGY